MSDTPEPEVTAEAAPALPPPRRWSQRQPLAAAIVYALLYLAVALAGGAFGMGARPSTLTMVVVTLAGIATTGLPLLLVLGLCRLRLTAAGEAGLCLLLTLVLLVVRPELLAMLAGLFRLHPSRLAFLAWWPHLPNWPLTGALGSLVLMVWAAFLGRLVSRVVREGKLLLPVAAAASMADVVTVFWGVVAAAQQQAPKVVEALSAQAPVKPPEGMVAPVLTSIGMGDFLFLAVFMMVILRYAMNPDKTIWVVFAAMVVAPIAFIIVPGLPGLPGLPFISAAVLIVNWRYLDFTKDEKRSLAIAAGLAALMIAGLAVMLIRRGK